jgi:hypothetical protein
MHNDRIVQIGDMTGAGWIAFGTQGGGTNQFADPIGIFLDATMRIYVTDARTNRIVRINDMDRRELDHLRLNWRWD